MSYNFSEAGGNWSTKGCTLMSVDNDDEVIVCRCNHLTNFGILVVRITSRKYNLGVLRYVYIPSLVPRLSFVDCP